MKIKYNSIYKLAIYIILFLNLDFLNFINNFIFKAMLISAILSILIFFLYLFQKNKRPINHKYIIFYVISVLVIFFFQLIRYSYLTDYMSPNIKTAINNYDGVFLLLLIFPIYEIIGDNEKDSFLRNIVFIGFGALSVRLITWGIYNFTSYRPYSSLIHAQNFKRSIFGFNLIRIAGTFLDPILLIFSLNKFFENKKYHKNIFWPFLGAIFVILYTILVGQFRLNIFAIILITIVVIFINKRNDKNSLINRIFYLLFILLCLFAGQNLLKDYFSSFSVNNTIAGGSTRVRLNGLPLFIAEWKKVSPLFGMGFVNSYMQYFNNLYWFSDYGILAELFRFGIIGFLIYLYPFITGVKILLVNCRRLKDTYIIGLTLFYLITFITIDPMENTNITLLPIYIALILNYFNLYERMKLR